MVLMFIELIFWQSNIDEQHSPHLTCIRLLIINDSEGWMILLYVFLYPAIKIAVFFIDRYGYKNSHLICWLYRKVSTKARKEKPYWLIKQLAV